MKWFVVLVFALIPPVYASAAKRLTVNDSFPDLRIKTMDGKSPSDPSEFKGKILVADFWASWCGPCKKSFPELNRFYRAYSKKGVEVVGINLDDDVSSAQKFLHDMPAAFTLLFDKEKKIAKALGVSVMPSSYVVDKYGKIRFVHAGYSGGLFEELEREVSSLK